jgi:hypothetical protein
MTLSNISCQLVHKSVQVTLSNELVRILMARTPAQNHRREAAMQQEDFVTHLGIF